MNQYYEQIMQLKGAEDFKDLISKWQRLSENMNSHPANMPVILPDMLWFAKSGSGKTKILRLLSGYLSSLGNLMEFYGDVKYFEFLLAYCAPNEPFREMQRLIDEVDNAAGFRSEYKGIVYIDIDEWKEHFEERHFVSFMEYLASNSDKWMIVLSVDSQYDEKVHNLEAFVSMFLRIERVCLSHPDSDALLEYLSDRLEMYGLILEDDAKSLLKQSIDVLRSNKYFDGFKSIQMLYQDIVYAIFSRGKVDRITASMLREFEPDSEYVKRTVFNIEKVNRIGFQSEANR